MTLPPRPAAMIANFNALALRVRAIIAGRPVLFCPNPGNWGDSLIRAGAKEFLAHYGFAYSEVPFRSILKGRKKIPEVIAAAGGDQTVLVYGGNGALTHHYDLARSIEEFSWHFSQSIILPSTMALKQGASGFHPHTEIFVRDRFESASALPQAQFCHDMAFFLNISADDFPPGKGVGVLFRTDKERPIDAPTVKPNLDLPRRGRSDKPINGFLKKVASFETIYTDRLHVGIAGALLGREVHLYANDYFKIRAIFDSSIAPFFPKVTFHGKIDVATLPRMSNWRKFT
jgi:exopolysaccharide biosynthesis predicted pyruvyltransferase EpsI